MRPTRPPPFTAASFWVLALLFAALHGAVAQEEALLSLPAACSNWDAATADVPGAEWQQGTNPCGALDGSSSAWKGLNCSSDSQVTGIELEGLGLAGTLPDQLAALSSVQLINLGDNAFEGSVPASWGEEGLMAALQELQLQGNNLQGTIPMPGWTSTSAFAAALNIVPRPGNTQLCGPVLPLDPTLFPTGNLDRNATLIPAANLLHTGEQMTTLALTQFDLFAPGTAVTITNWLGSCMVPCDQVPGGQTQAPPDVAAAGLPWPPAITTNIYDLSWQYNMTMADLVQLNPAAATLKPGDQPRLPCYPSNPIPFGYYGGSTAFGMFSGGNQLAGPEGLPAAMAAARINAGFPNTFHWPSIYFGSAAPDSEGGGIVQPVYWFVDMLASYNVATVLVTAGAASTNASIYVGNDSTSVQANTRVASGINLAAGQQLAFPAGGVRGRYVVIYGGMLSEGAISLDDVQVYTYETNAAANKPVTASALSASQPDGGAGDATAASLEVLVDNNASTCVWLAGDGDTQDTPAYATVDLGYSGKVGSVAIVTGSDVADGTDAQVYVTSAPSGPFTDATACSSEGRNLASGSWAAGTCNREGRYVTLMLPSTLQGAKVQVCEFQVAITLRPGEGTPTSSSGGLDPGAIAGIVLGGLLAAALLALATGYWLWRRRWLSHQSKMAALGAADKGFDQAEWDRQHAHEIDGGSSSAQTLPKRSVDGSGAAAAAVPAADLQAGGSGGSGGEEIEDLEAAKSGGKGDHQALQGAANGSGGKNAGQKAVAATSELQLIRQFFRALLGRHTLQDFSNYRSKTVSAFSMGRLNGGGGVGKADTDMSKLPDGFSEVAPADIQLIDVVGEGSFGEVWLAKYCGALVAVKILARIGSDNLTSSLQNDLLMRSLKKEALLMSKLRHPNVCLYLGACTNPPSLVFEYCAKSSLDMLLRAGLRHPQMAKRLAWPRLLGMALDAAKGMLYLHTRGPPIAHRDLKSANLLVDSQWRVKVSDFSLSRALELEATSMTVVMTNPRWLAPEVLNGLPGHLPADVWAFGTVLWELLTWRIPFENLNTYQIISVVQRTGSSGLSIPLQSELAAGPFIAYPQYVQLMKACWSHDAAARPKFAAVVEQLGLMLAAELAPAHAAAAAAAAEIPPTISGSGPRGPALGGGRPPAALPQQRQKQQQQQRPRVQQQGGQPSPSPARSADGSNGSSVALSGALAAALPPGIPEHEPLTFPHPPSTAAAKAGVAGGGKGPNAPPPSANGSQHNGSGSAQSRHPS